MSRRGFVVRLVMTVQVAALAGAFLSLYAFAVQAGLDDQARRDALGRHLLYGEGAALLVTGLISLRLLPVLRLLGVWDGGGTPAPAVVRAAQARALAYPLLFPIELAFLSLAGAAAALAWSTQDTARVLALDATHAVLGVAIALGTASLLGGVLRSVLRRFVLQRIAALPGDAPAVAGLHVSLAPQLALTAALLAVVVVLIWGSFAYSAATGAVEQAIADERGRWLEQVLAPQVRVLPPEERLSVVARALAGGEVPFLLGRGGRVVGAEPLPYGLAWSEVSFLAGAGALHLYRPVRSPVRVLALPLGVDGQVLCVAYRSRAAQAPSVQRVLRTGGGVALVCVLFAALTGLQVGRALAVDLRQLTRDVRDLAQVDQPVDRAWGAPLALGEIGELSAAFDDLRQRVEARVGALSASLVGREQADAERRRVAASTGALTAALIPVIAGVALMPLTGYYDEERAAHIRPSLLDGVKAARVRVLLVDLAGVTGVSDALVDHLARSVRSIVLMGCEVVLTGAGPEVAWSLARMSADLGRLPARRDLSEALAYAQARLDGEREAIG